MATQSLSTYSIRKVICEQAGFPAATSPCSACFFILGTEKKPFGGGENIVFALQDHKGRTICMRIQRYSTLSASYNLENEVRFREAIEKIGILGFQKVIGYAVKGNDLIYAPFITLEWTHGTALRWADNSPAAVGDRNKVLRAIATITIDLLGIQEPGASAKAYVRTRIARKIERAERHEYRGGGVEGCYKQFSLIETYCIQDLDEAPYVLEHGDLSSNNIIVDEDFNVKRSTIMADNPRARSRSPRVSHTHSHNRRNRSPRQRQDHSHHRNPPPKPRSKELPKSLPFNSKELTKKDFKTFKPMFALYLDIQKGKILEELDETEVKGRWKSFFGKWNRGELSEGWYDPETLNKAVQAEAEDAPPISERTKAKSMISRDSRGKEMADASESDDEIGPTLPGQESRGREGRMGPSIPNMQDLELKREMEAEDGLAYREDIRHACKLDRKEQKAALDELMPRAEAGTRERQLEKKKEVNAKMKSFREKSPGAAEVPDAELMGGGEGIDGYKKAKQEFERKKNERELRKEEILRARTEEREERLKEYREKEEGTMEMLRKLAKERFG